MMIIMPLRVLVGILVTGILSLVGYFLAELRFQLRSDTFEFLQEWEAILGSVVSIGAGILFLLAVETRLKRMRARQRLPSLFGPCRVSNCAGISITVRSCWL